MGRHPRLASGLVAGGLLLAAMAAPAEEPGDTAPPPGPAATVPAPTLHGQLALSLQEAIGMAIENNLDVQIARFDPLIASEDAIAAWGLYDPRLFGEYGYGYREIPVASSLQQNSILLEKEYSGSAGILGEIPKLGWGYRIDYGGERLETTSSINDLSPGYSTGLTATVILPFLKGFLWNEPWLLVKTTGIQEGVSLERFRAALMDTVEGIENAYWNLIAMAERLRVANKSLEARLTLLDRVKAQYDVGVVSRVEVVEAEAGVAEGEVTRIRQENFYLKAQDTLIDLVLGPNLTPDSTLEIQPTTLPDVVQYDIDAEAATAKAFSNRPELAAAQAEVESRTLALKFAKNQRLPQVDAIGAYGYNGIAGRTNPAPGVFGTPRAPVVGVGEKYGDADDDFFEGDGARSWSFGGVFSIPLGNVTARAQARRAEFELRRARTLVRREEQDIVLEVRDAIRDLRSAREGIEAAERRRLAAEEQFRAESIRLEHGESTPFELLQREEDLVDAESQKITSLQIYRDSVAGLDRAQGTILRDRNVLVEQARALR